MVNHLPAPAPRRPGLKPMIARYLLRKLGWKAEGRIPGLSRYVIIAAPHTSNWDFIYTVLIGAVFGLRVSIMAKKELFRWPVGWFFRMTGCFPVDRGRAGNTVDQLVRRFEASDDLVLVMSPAGTRRKVACWRSGFYHIARGAGVPVVLGYLDYARKAGGIGPVVHLTGDMAADMVEIRAFYNGVTGKNPEKAITIPLADCV